MFVKTGVLNVQGCKKTPYDINFYKFAWKKQPDDNWFETYSDMIKDIYNGNNF